METISTTEARTGLSQTLAGFRRLGVNAEPVVFGDHRKPEGVVLPYELFQRVQHDLAQARLLANSDLMGAIDAFHAEPTTAVKVSRHRSRDKR
jgi:PHD/YefM family antitoxin component YafN of YafNO toxin-antitoxin module